MKRVVMVVLDGWGIGRKDESNPIHTKNPKNINYIRHNYLSGSLQASGIAVGLPWGEEGNSEVGHLTLGGGKVFYQHFPRISLAIRDGSFFTNKVLLETVGAAVKRGGRVNIIGLLTSGTVHASFEHLVALIKAADQLKVPQLNLHLFTDGKDSSPKGAVELLRKLREEIKRIGYQGVKLGSISGRYFAMDRDLHWPRTEKTYNIIVGGEISNSKSLISNDNGIDAAIDYIENSYKQGSTDEFIEPATISQDAAAKDGDSIIFFNFREDSMRQITEMFIKQTAAWRNCDIATFTEYNAKFNLPVAFPAEKAAVTLSKILSDQGKIQLRVAETEKYAHVTYFFNGLTESPFKNEYRVLIPSKNVPRHDEYPEMMAKDITTRAVEAVSENVYDFMLINYANADIVAHTGNFEAAERAIQAIDEQIGRLMDATLKNGHVLLITSDHGNVERMMDPKTGLAETKHDASAVPIYIVAKEYAKNKDDFDVERAERESVGLLSDVAPTILSIMGIEKPKEMTGIDIINSLS